jgi:hypothetical protein
MRAERMGQMEQPQEGDVADYGRVAVVSKRPSILWFAFPAMHGDITARTFQRDSLNSGGEESPRGELDSATALVTTRTPLSSIHNEELVIIQRRLERSAKRMQMGGKR